MIVIDEKLQEKNSLFPLTQVDIENTLEKEIGKKIYHFAFPYGSANEVGYRELRLIKQYNFKTVFGANGGCITNNNCNGQLLPRVYLHEGNL